MWKSKIKSNIYVIGNSSRTGLDRHPVCIAAT